jgi:hypothetical protein
MNARIEFGFLQADGNYCFSSEHWLESYEIDFLPSKGNRFRFDVPDFDSDGRWALERDMTFDVDGGSPIYGVVSEVTIHTNHNKFHLPSCFSIELEVEGSADDKEDKDTVLQLIKHLEFARFLKDKGSARISDGSLTGLSKEQSFFLQRKGIQTVQDVATTPIGSFGKGDLRRVLKIEKVLHERLGIMFSASRGWLSYQGKAQ